MSDVKCSVRLSVDVSMATGDERPFMQNIAISPSSEPGTVIVKATDCRVAVVVPMQGETDAQYLMPSKLFPSKKSDWKSKPSAELNGKWTTNYGKCGDESLDRFPRLETVIPAIHPDKQYVAIGIDPAVFAKIACLANETNKAITLLIDPTAVDTNGSIESAVIAIGDNGIGALMPVLIDPAASKRQFEHVKSLMNVNHT